MADPADPKTARTPVDWAALADLSPAAIETAARDILDRMTLKQKAHQMAGDESLIWGGLRMLVRYNAHPLPAGVDENLGIPGILFVDGPRGVVMNASTCFPVSMARGASWDVALEERVGDAIGIEARAQGANFFGGVCINLLRHPAWGRAQETYGEDPHHLGEMGAALTRGVQRHVMACAKHYACNSMENARFKVDVSVDERTLREIYLRHFKRCVDEGVASIMSAYNKVNGAFCGHNVHLLRDILKRDWGFTGFVISDFLLGIRDGVAAIKGGLDIEMPHRWRMKPRKIVKFVRKGAVAEDLVDEAVLRILRQKLRFNRTRDSARYAPDKVACAAHVALAREAAQKGMVLLKNDPVPDPAPAPTPAPAGPGSDSTETRPLLPFHLPAAADAPTCRVVVLGKLADTPNTGDHGSSRVYPPHVVTPLEGIRAAVAGRATVTYDAGKDPLAAARLARAADLAVVVVGYTHKQEGEYVMTKGGDRDDLRLRAEDEALIQAVASETPRCVVVIETGSAVITEAWRARVPAILVAWYPGMEGGHALADLLLGRVNPSGKLPVVFPRAPDQLPFFDKDAKAITYEYYHGYRLLDQQGADPAFPFGWGQSYTTYAYANARVTNADVPASRPVEVKVDVTNAGARAGEEVVQAYVSYEESTVDRPPKELKAFTRVALQPGETQTVTLAIDPASLAYYDIEAREWRIEKMAYRVLVGPSSRDEDLLAVPFRVT